MIWTLVLAAAVSAVCLAFAAAFALWAGGVALPEGRRFGLARHVARIRGASSAPSPFTLGVLACVFAVAGLLPWGLAMAPEAGRFGFVFPVLGLAFAFVFLSHGAGLGGMGQGPTFDRNDRRVYTPLACALGAGFLLLAGAWFG